MPEIFLTPEQQVRQQYVWFEEVERRIPHGRMMVCTKDWIRRFGFRAEAAVLTGREPSRI